MRYHDIHGKTVDTEEAAYSRTYCRPHTFEHSLKKKTTKRRLYFKAPFGLGIVTTTGFVWRFHHRSTTYGSWMWPDGLPLRGDGVDTKEASRKHAESIGSSWGFGPSV